MTPKQRVHAAMAGEAVDRYPVGVTYGDLYWMDHLSELTGAPPWANRTLWYRGAREHLELFREIVAKAPFDVQIPMLRVAPRAERDRQEFVTRDGRPFRHDTLTNEWQLLDEPSRSGYAQDGAAPQEQTVFDIKDIDEQITVTPAAELAREGELDAVEAVVREFGDEVAIVGGGATGVFWTCVVYVGQLRLLSMLIDQPKLIDALCERIVQVDIEGIRRLAETGADIVRLDDAMATGEMISVAHYERFSLPYMKAMVDEVHRLGMKAVAIYFGSVMDRLEQIASLGADALQLECSMKGYINNIDTIAETIGDRVTLFSNIDPVWCLEKGSDAELEAEIRRQVAAGRKARGFILAPASPITLDTPLPRVQKFIHLCRTIGEAT